MAQPSRDELDQAIFEAIKVARSAIRLRKSIEADRELNTKLPQIREIVTEAYQNGLALDLDVAALFLDEGPA